MTIKNYDVVRVKAIRDDRFASKVAGFQRHPQPGDTGTIVEIYPDAFEVECLEQGTGMTIWLETMYLDELDIVQQTGG